MSVGLCAIAVMSLRSVHARVALHHALHPEQWHCLPSITKLGLVETLRRHDVTLFGFQRPTRWTTDAPTCPLAKHDALAGNIIEMLTRHDAFGRRRGTSLFIESGTSEERTPRKQQYLAGLTTEAVDEYRMHMTRLSGTVVESTDAAVDLSCRLTFLIHFHREPTTEEARALRRVADALTYSLHHVFHSRIESSKTVLHRAVQQTSGGMTRRWIAAGMSHEDAYVELMHNVFGMTLQWAYLLRRLALSDVVIETLEDAAHFVLDDLPAKVAGSRVHGALVIHDLEERCKQARRPVLFDAPQTSLHVVHRDQPIASETDDHYVPFGYGARRCPGEWLTYILLLTLRVTSSGEQGRKTRVGLNRI